MKVFETQLPGVGRRYTLSFPSGGEFVVVVHNDGRRRTYWRDEEADSEPLFETTESQARKLAEIFDGTYFHPVEESIEEALEDARIRWIAVDERAPIAGSSLGELRLRSRTGASVLAVQRGERTISNPDADTEIRAGDTLVVVGTPEAYDALDELLGA